MAKQDVKPAGLADMATKMAAKLSIPHEQAVLAVRAFIESADELLLERTRVVLKGFCSFSIKVRPAGLYKRYVVLPGEDPEVFRPDRPVAFMRMSTIYYKKIEQLGSDPEQLARIIAISKVTYDRQVAKMATQASKRAIWKQKDMETYNNIKRTLLAKYGITDVKDEDLQVQLPKTLVDSVRKEYKNS